MRGRIVTRLERDLKDRHVSFRIHDEERNKGPMVETSLFIEAGGESCVVNEV